MDHKRPSWAQIIASSLTGAGLLILLLGLMHRYLFHEGFKWDESAGVAVATSLFWVLGGALQRSGWWAREELRRREQRAQEHPKQDT